VPTGITAHASEAVFQDPAGEELVDHVADNRPPIAPTAREPFVVDGAELFEVILEKTV
jgi:hypothetical protein